MRKAALEFMTTLSESKPGMLRNEPAASVRPRSLSESYALRGVRVYISPYASSTSTSSLLSLSLLPSSYTSLLARAPAFGECDEPMIASRNQTAVQ